MQGARPDPGSPIVTSLALLAAAFWVHYLLVHDLLGLLTVDEIYFAHVFWLMREGLEPYSDFYSTHLPAYFRILGVLVPPAPPLDLSFVWTLRAVSALVVTAYAILLLRLARRDFLFLLPLLLLFVTFARMAEIRPDTFGLLLFNVGWWWLLRGTGRVNILLAAAFAGAALFFSARAAVMIVGLALLCAWLCVRRRDWATFLYLVLLAVGLGAIAALAYVADPTGFTRMVTSVYLDPIVLMPDLTIGQRVLSVDRLLLLAMILAALAAALLAIARGKNRETATVVAAACLTQLVLVVADPSPFQYVYGWAALPTLAGIALLGRYSVRGLHAGLALAGSALAIGLVSLSLAQAAAADRPPRPGSMLRITYDPPLSEAELRRASTPDLVSMMVRTERQQGLWNQLALLTEICRRVRGPVLAKFYAHPICLHDLRHDWAGLKWPPMLAGDPGSGSMREFEALFARRPPELVAWGKQHFTPEPTPWGRSLLKDYDIHEGFALRRAPGPRRPSASRVRR
ncbi:MAG TPA: hypothetical protein VFK58_00260 [Sphingomicrobium sp.]|nr:hypothetical protein [Sphingomicrobium sp.]